MALAAAIGGQAIVNFDFGDLRGGNTCGGPNAGLHLKKVELIDVRPWDPAQPFDRATWCGDPEALRVINDLPFDPANLIP